MDSGDPHSLTLVLATSRSGSALLCRDLKSLGGLGFPEEHLTGLDKQVRRGPVSETDVLERLARGCQDDAPGVAAAKLLVSQAGFTFHALTGHPAESSSDAMLGVVSWARERFDRVLLVVLVRNALDQAISRAVAQATGIHHATDRAYDALEATPPPADQLNEQILVELVSVERSRKPLHSVLSANADIALPVTYEELTAQGESTTSRIVARARAQGFEVRREVVKRRRGSTTGTDRSDEIREGFLDYLTRETGALPEHSVDSPQPVPQVEVSGR